MFERISNGWTLAMESVAVLRQDKEMLLFPLLSGAACLLVLASFIVPLHDSEIIRPIIDEQQAPQNPLAYVLLFAFYFVNYFVIVFFNSALIACAIKRFGGGNPTLGDGFRAAFNRLPQIAGWALVSATVGVILKVIESRSERAGKIASALLGTGWAIATFFVIPILVIEKVGPIQATKRSMSIMRKTWGEALTSSFSIGLVTFVGTMLAVLPAMAGIVLVSGEHAAIGWCLIAIAFVWVVFVSLVTSALQAILLGALYLYAANGAIPDAYQAGEFKHAFGGGR